MEISIHPLCIRQAHLNMKIWKFKTILFLTLYFRIFFRDFHRNWSGTKKVVSLTITICPPLSLRCWWVPLYFRGRLLKTKYRHDLVGSLFFKVICWILKECIEKAIIEGCNYIGNNGRVKGMKDVVDSLIEIKPGSLGYWNSRKELQISFLFDTFCS